MTPTQPTPAQVQRLAFAKYLLFLASEQMSRPEPLTSAAVLLMHDAVESLNILIAEHVGVTATPREFMDYWGAQGPKPDGAELPHRVLGQRLNSLRKELKHRGSFPALRTVRELVDSVQSYFRDATALSFGVAIESISLVDFVSVAKVRDYLQQAVACQERGALSDGLLATSGAFAELVTDFEERTQDRFGEPLLGKPLDWSYPGKISAELGGSQTGRFLQEVARRMNSMHERLTLLSCGIDVRQHARFKRLTPHPVRYSDGHLEFNWSQSPSARGDDLDFCIQFVIESALRVQEFELRGTNVPDS